MEFKRLVEQKSEEAWKSYIPSLSVDCVVFGFHDNILKVMALKMLDQDVWSLPGGYVKKQEAVDEAAERILKERTGAKDIYLEQFHVFSDLNRSEGFFADYDDSLWHKQRFISIGHYALIDYSKVGLTMDEFSEACEWKSINELPKFMMDHREILDKALLTLRERLNNRPIGYNLLPEKFTMPELQKLYEIILDKKLNRGNFYRKMLRYDILVKLDESRKGGAHKSPDLYRFDVNNYETALKEGFKGW